MNTTKRKEDHPITRHQNKITKQDESLEDAEKAFYQSNKYDEGVSNFSCGANWQKENDKAIQDKLIEALQKAGTLLDFVINATKTGANRNHLTDANIYIKSALQSIQKDI